MRNLLQALTIGLLALLAQFAAADQEQPKRINILHDQQLSDAPGQRGVLLTVRFAPGQVSTPHVHPGSVLAYVLEGTVVTQQEGGPVQRFKAGESWYEAPGVPHVQARNGSEQVPATLLVWQLLPTGEPLLRPVQ